MVSATELWHTLEHAITNYTGLSPATFFTILAVALAFYYLVSGFFQAPPPPRKREVEFEQMEPLPPPVQLGEITEEELSAYDGADPKKPLLMAIKGQIYDVTQSRMFYGPGGPYALFAGKDASRALAKMSFEQKDLTGDISGLGPFELEALQDWEYKFMSKYVKVGTITKTVPVTEGNTSETTETSAQTTKGAPAESPAEPTAESKEGTQAVYVKSEEDITVAHGAEEKHESKDTPAVHVKSEEDITVAHGAQAVYVKSEEDITVAHGAEEKHESKDTPAIHVKSEEDITVAHGAEEKHESKDTPAVHVKSEEDITVAHGAEEKHIPEPKEAGVAEETKE